MRKIMKRKSKAADTNSDSGSEPENDKRNEDAESDEEVEVPKKSKKGRRSKNAQPKDDESGSEKEGKKNDDLMTSDEETEIPKKNKKRRSSKNAQPKDDESGSEKEEKKNDDLMTSDEETEAPKKAKRGRKSKNTKQKENGKGAESDNEETSPRRKKTKKATKNNPEETEEVEYEVEAILDHKNIRGVRNFLIRWKGFDEDGDTWEPEPTLNCADLLSKYLKQKGLLASPKKKGKHSKASSKDDEENEDPTAEYEVDRIIDVYFRRDGKREFLVHWKGYSANDNTWEPEDNMNCKDLIERFMIKVEKAREADQRRELRAKRQMTQRFTLTTHDTGRRVSKRFNGKQRVLYHDNE